MKKIILILSCFLFCFPIVVYGQIDRVNDTRMLHDPGEGGGGGKTYEKIQERSRTTFKTLLDLFRTPGTTEGDGNPSPGTNPNATPTPITGLPLSITPVNLPPANTLLNNENLTYDQTTKNAVRPCLNNKNIYDAASAATSVPWQILASIHYREGGCGANKSLVSGRVIGQNEPDLHGNCSSQDTGIGKPRATAAGCIFDNLLDTAVYAGNHLKGKIGGIPQRHEQLAEAFAGYNGWGNTNCGKTPYPHCPPAFKGDDHVYVFNKTPDGKHETMYLIYCADYTKCNPPRVYQGLGAMTVAGAIDEVYREQNGN